MQPIRKMIPIITLCGAASLLSACGEDWVAQPIRHIVPYNDERTAGPGVQYVRAYMMPEKGPKLEPLTPENNVVFEDQRRPAAMDAPVMQDATPVFEGRQFKGMK